MTQHPRSCSEVWKNEWHISKMLKESLWNPGKRRVIEVRVTCLNLIYDLKVRDA